MTQISIGAVPDVTNNQVQVITTSRDLSTQDVEQFITYPVELEMANLPGIKEIRSISKFGLSVVTIVFEDRLGTYLPRQLIAEKIESAAENIPEGFGKPEMGPITTGLGEIYQYVLEVAPEYKDQYSTMDLRTIQDWIVKRQLSGIPGVVEVNTWGGYLKQYEVTINPQKLRSIDITLAQIFSALEENNSVAGGGYIEKSDQAHFIRGEGLTKNIEDIENIVVENREGFPIYIKDIAEVNYGYATRFGAITGNGEGEKVLGQVMMLKNANSKMVIESVKQRVKDIKDALPPGISINPFLERSELIGKTTTTIAENLILGCLIVVFVVVLLLGNFRTGLVVASVIPLCLLFAISFMYIFGIDANLMSLGAIDFGIIIDGAVIIVEYIAYKVTSQQSEMEGLDTAARKSFLDKVTFESTNKMMHSAVFGQLIIIIVFIPILSLANVEGKMFKPMALTFCFALIGAMIFCFTYIPVISSMFLKPSTGESNNFSARLMRAIRTIYRPVLLWALDHRKTVIASAAAILVGAFLIFDGLGGEFVPTLDEGDFVIQPVLETGTSLSKTIDITTDIERVVRKFPEVRQVVTRIGAAEVPTDPMSMEETDVIITLRPKEEWTSATSKDELADLIKEELLREIPDADYEFTQPIEMRFNELITGVRSDLAIKIFGEDLDLLVEKADEIESLIEDVEGASDITVEKIDGLPQMSVAYDRQKIARYGLNISDVNEVISMGFAGKVAGSVFEGEKRFDLVVRYGQDFRHDIQNLREASVETPGGSLVPLRELAQVTNTLGPAKISRDDTQRRIVVGVNVRNRDLESVVDDVRVLIDDNITLPPGYRITYGGQFENLENARKRLAFAVPLALVLILIMLHFAFHSIKEALMIYTAIPLAAVGGVLFLWVRDMPFSISAGVGFIALFGIAVLNGIVLIGHYKALKVNSKMDLKELIIEATMQRLRPVLLTASAAAMGFLPMAASTSVGAEVQRPVATVVIGGLITATILTLLVLPVLYYMLDGKFLRIRFKRKAALLLLCSMPFLSTGQEVITLDQAIEIATQNNIGLRASEMAVKRQETLMSTAFDFDKTNIFHSYDENNIAENAAALKVWGVQQSFKFPTTYSKGRQLQRSRVQLEEVQYIIEEKLVQRNVSKAYYKIMYLESLRTQYRFLDSVYSRFAEAAHRRFDLGETNILENLTAESKQIEIELLLDGANNELDQAYSELYRWMQSNREYKVDVNQNPKYQAKPIDSVSHPVLRYYQLKSLIAEKSYQLNQSQWLPDLQFEYFKGTNNAENSKVYSGYEIGVSIPLLFSAQRSRVKAAKLEHEQMSLEMSNYRIHFLNRYRQLRLQLRKYDQMIDKYDRSGRTLANTLISTSIRSFESGEIDFFQYIQSVDRGIQIKIRYLQDLQQYNESAIEINYLLN